MFIWLIQLDAFDLLRCDTLTKLIKDIASYMPKSDNCRYNFLNTATVTLKISNSNLGRGYFVFRESKKMSN